MGQRLLNVRVRPARFVVLISRDASRENLLMAFEILSKLWGGRFASILSVDPNTCDDLTRFRLGASRPDCVYGVGLDDKHWEVAVDHACQPRSYEPLTPALLQGLKRERSDNHFLVDHALIHLFQKREQIKKRRQQLRLVMVDPSSPFAPYCAATFGIHHQDLRKDLFDIDTPLSEPTATSFIKLATEFVQDWQQSWLDVTGHVLTIRVGGHGWAHQLSPTIVLVGHPIEDLSLFWNLRTSSDTDTPAWIIPIPVEEIESDIVMEELKTWLLAFLPYGHQPNFCHVTSQTVSSHICHQFAAKLQETLKGTVIEFVDYEAPRNRLPIVTPYEYETAWPVSLVGRKLTIQPPRPKAFEELSSSRCWFIDLLKDLKTGRAINGLKLPSGPVIFELLNGPCPPTISPGSKKVGDGLESINIRCSGKTDVVAIQLPSEEEIFEELLRNKGIESIHDEKRSGYLPTIRRFGGVHAAARAFIGQSGNILTSVQDRARTVAEIKGTCHLGNGVLSEDKYWDNVEAILQHESEVIQRIGRRRFREHDKKKAPENLSLVAMLEYWANRSVLVRRWQIGPCGNCKQTSYLAAIRAKAATLCPVCGNRMAFREKLPLAYALHSSVQLAMKEGIAPVVLAGRFLFNLSNEGFFWLPGLKYHVDHLHGDLDLIACVDGHLVFGECKDLESASPKRETWISIAEKFCVTVTQARRCGASLVVLAALVESFPDEVLASIEEVRGEIPCLFLTKTDLEAGRRRVQDGDESRTMRLRDLLPMRFPEEPRERTGPARTINLGWGIYTL